MSLVHFLVDGLGEVTDDVIYGEKGASLGIAAGGEPELSNLSIRDFGTVRKEFLTGKRMTVHVDGAGTLWAGYITRAARTFWFDVDNPDTLHRKWDLALADINLLFRRRFVFNQATPERVQGPVYKAQTYDDDVIAELLGDWLDLSADDLDLASRVARVGYVNPSGSACIGGNEFYPFNGGMSWGEAMAVIAQLPAAVFALVPGEPIGSSPFGRLLYADVEDVNAPFVLSDRPTPGVPGGENTADPFDRVTDYGLGIGYTWIPDDSSFAAAEDSTYFVDGEKVVIPGDPTFGAEDSYDIDEDPPATGVVQFDIFFPVLPSYDGFDDWWPAVIAHIRSNGDGFALHVEQTYDDTPSVNIGDTWNESIAVPIDPGNWYTAKMIYNGDTFAVRYKMWKVGDPEPDWMFDGSNVGDESSSNGKSWLDFFYAGSIDAYLDNFVRGAGEGEPAQAGYRDVMIWDDGADLANDSMAWGFGKGQDHGVFDRRSDQDSIDEHGLWQRADTLFSVWCQDTIEKVTDSVVNGSPQSKRGQKDPVRSVELVTYVPGLQVGQRARFINHEYGVNEVLPVRKMKLVFPTPDLVRTEATLSHAIDRWGFEDPVPPFKTPPTEPIGEGVDGDSPCGETCWENPPFHLDDFTRNPTLVDAMGSTTWGGYQWLQTTAITGHFCSAREGGGGWPDVPERFDVLEVNGQMGIFLPTDYRYSDAYGKLTLPISSVEDDMVIEFDAFISQATMEDPDGTEDGLGPDMWTYLNIGFGGLEMTLGDETGPFLEIEPGTDYYRQRTIIQVDQLDDFENENGNLWEGETGVWRSGVHVKLESHKISETQKTVKVTVGAVAIQHTVDYDDNHFSPQDFDLSMHIGGGLRGDDPTPPLDRYDATQFYCRIDNLKIATSSGTCDLVPQRVGVFYDDFERTETVGLGDSPAPLISTYVQGDDDNSGAGDVSVNGSEGHFRNIATGLPPPGNATNRVERQIDIAGTGWRNGEFILTGKMRATVDEPNNPSNGDYDFGVIVRDSTNDLIAAQCGFFFLMSPRPTAGFNSVRGLSLATFRDEIGGVAASYSNQNIYAEGPSGEVFVDGTWAEDPGTDWMFELDLSLSRGDMRARVWHASRPMPEYVYEQNPAFYHQTYTVPLVNGWGTGLVPASLHIDTRGSSNVPVEMHSYLDWVRIACGARRSVAIGSHARQRATRVSDTEYRVSSAYDPATVLVWRNGVMQRSGVDFNLTDPGAGLIEFTSSVSVFETIMVWYVSTGIRDDS